MEVLILGVISTSFTSLSRSSLPTALGGSPLWLLSFIQTQSKKGRESERWWQWLSNLFVAVSARLFAQKGQLFSVIHTRLETGKHSDSVCQIAEVETHKENIAKLGSHTTFVLFLWTWTFFVWWLSDRSCFLSHAVETVSPTPFSHDMTALGISGYLRRCQRYLRDMAICGIWLSACWKVLVGRCWQGLYEWVTGKICTCVYVWEGGHAYVTGLKGCAKHWRTSGGVWEPEQQFKACIFISNVMTVIAKIQWEKKSG